MTQDEARKLKPGDHVEVFLPSLKEMVEAVVTKIIISCMREEISWVEIRRIGSTRAGRKYAVIDRRPMNIHLVKKYEGISANVYADWLEDHGESTAAAKLRLAFPIDDGNGEM